MAGVPLRGRWVLAERLREVSFEGAAGAIVPGLLLRNAKSGRGGGQILQT